jgi:hypothetical protein
VRVSVAAILTLAAAEPLTRRFGGPPGARTQNLQVEDRLVWVVRDSVG